MAIAAIMRSRARQRLSETEANWEYAGRPVWDSHLKPLDPCHQILSASPEVGTQLTYIDVMPKVNKYSLFEGGKPTSYTFRTILTIANQWLALHPDHEVVNCQSIAMPLTTRLGDFNQRSMGAEAELNPSRTSYWIPMNSDENIMVRFLRMWVRAKVADQDGDLCSKRAQTLNYLDLRPRKVPVETQSKCRKRYSDKLNNQDGVNQLDKEYKIQNLDDLTDSLNQLIDLKQVHGKILACETIQSPATIDWNELPVEQTTYIHDRRYLLGLRIYYDSTTQVSQQCEQHLGIKDFVPKRLGGGGIFKKPYYEQMSDVVDRAERWLAQNPEFALLNSQSLEMKHKYKNFDTHQLAQSEQGDYIRVFRLVYLKPQDSYSRRQHHHSGSDSDEDSEMESYQPPPAPIYLATKLFFPHSDKETLASLSENMNTWIAQNISHPNTSLGGLTSDNYKGIRVLFAETIETVNKTTCRSLAEMEKYIEGTFQTGRFGTRGADMNIAIRLYYDEGYFRAQKRDQTHLPSPTHSTVSSLWGMFTRGGGGGGSTLSLLPPPPPTIDMAYHTDMTIFVEEDEVEHDESLATEGQRDLAQGRGSLPESGGGQQETQDSPPGYEEAIQ